MDNIDSNKQVDLLWKKFLHNVTETDVKKGPREESNQPSSLVVASDIWRNDHLIPEVAGDLPDVVEHVNVQLIRDTSVEDHSTWIAVVDTNAPNIMANRMMDFIPPRFGPTYEVQVFADENHTNPIYVGEFPWVFDYNGGILWFPQIDKFAEPIETIYLSGFRYIGPKGLAPTFGGEVIDVLGPLTDGNYAGGYVPGFEVGETKISDAIDRINRAMNDFVPRGPATLSEQYLQILGVRTSMGDSNFVLANGFSDISGDVPGKPYPGSMVGKVVGMNIDTEMVGPFGNSKQGTLSVMLNGAASGQKALTPGDDSGIYGNLYIYEDHNFGDTMASYYEVAKAKAVNLMFSPGMNSVYLNHSESGRTNTVFVVNDSSNQLPQIFSSGVSEVLASDVRYSSGIPHYGIGSTLSLSASVGYLATDLTLDTQNVVFSANSADPGPTVWAYPGRYNLPEVLTKGDTYGIEGVQFVVADTETTVSSGTFSFNVTARNANGIQVQTNPTRINYMRGDPSGLASPISESGILVENLGDAEFDYPQRAQRILLPSGSYPQWGVWGEEEVPEMPAPWVSVDVLPQWEAAIVGGSLRHTRENYSNYLPSGPNYSTKPATQYATFMIQRKNVSNMNIWVQGKYSGLSLKLPGLTNQTLAPNGWMDCFTPYMGHGVPGREVPVGCAVGRPATGGTQEIRTTFGYASSSSSLFNLIFVRFTLAEGDAITGLKFFGD